METLSPMAVDVEMESPRGQSEDLITRQEAGMIDSRACAHTLCMRSHFVHLGVITTLMHAKAAVGRISLLKFV